MNARLNMKRVELPEVRTIDFKRPNLADNLELPTAENAIVIPETARKGPLYVSGTPNFNFSHVPRNGLINPAPHPISLLIPEHIKSRLMLPPTDASSLATA